MKKHVALVLLLNSSAFAHKVQPESQFFKDQLAKNPGTMDVLAYCSLVGLSDESDCQAEFYKNGTISETKVKAAANCVEKSGLKYRANLDAFFEGKGKDASLVSHKMIGSSWHTFYAQDDGEKARKEPGHRHAWTDDSRKLAGREAGTAAVTEYKNNHTTDTKTITSATSSTGGGTLGIPGSGVTGSLTHGGSTADTTSKQITQADLDREYKKGYEYGYNNPDKTSIVPDTACFKNGQCANNEKGYHDNPDNVASNKAKATEGAKESPKPVKEEEPAPFAPGTKEKDLGAVKEETNAAATEAATTDSDVVETDEPKDEHTTTPLDDDQPFRSSINDCVEREEYKIFKDEGSKTKDQDAQTEEEKKAEAEAKLKDGNCDESFYGAEFCQEFKNKQASHEAQDAKEKAEAAKAWALENFQLNGICDSMILGFKFCQNAKALQDIDMDNPIDEVDTSHLGDGAKEPEPEGGSIPGIDGPFWIKPGTPHPIHGVDGEPGADPLGRPRLPRP